MYITISRIAFCTFAVVGIIFFSLLSIREKYVYKEKKEKILRILCIITGIITVISFAVFIINSTVFYFAKAVK